MLLLVKVTSDFSYLGKEGRCLISRWGGLAEIAMDAFEVERGRD